MSDDPQTDETSSWDRMRSLIGEVLDEKRAEWEPQQTSKTSDPDPTPDPPKQSSPKKPGFLFESFFGKKQTTED